MLSTVEKVREESDDESIQDQEYSYAPLQNEPDEQPIEPIKVTIKEQDRMSKEEISRIKEVMSKIKLDPPPNFANLNDEDWMPTVEYS